MIVWYRRGDGFEFAVPAGSEAQRSLISSGAEQIAGPGASATSSESQSLSELKRDELVAIAESLGLPTKGTKAELSRAIVDARVAASAQAPEQPPADQGQAQGGDPQAPAGDPQAPTGD